MKETSQNYAKSSLGKKHLNLEQLETLATAPY